LKEELRKKLEAMGKPREPTTEPPNEIQMKVLDLFRHASFNLLDAEKVVEDLLKHRDWWTAVWPSPGRIFDLIPLRDIADGILNVDTLYIIPAKGKEREIEALAKSWQADEVEWLSEEECSERLGMFPAETEVLRVWWD